MKELKFEYTRNQYNALDGLAYRIADNAYMIERYGRDDAAIELKQNHDTIMGLFDDLDRMGVPFWVQNTVICWAENWKAYKSNYLYLHLEKKNITAA